MTLDKARQLLATQADFGGPYNCNAAKLILAEVSREHGQGAVDRPGYRTAPGPDLRLRGTEFKGNLTVKSKFG